ncbi:MAG: DUF4870 domain-containing protein [Zoogloeaceae bacterium]|jgi:uncharacterized Tic20 family protein|nr:DUF4870 domain-containing protein [Zoogloeaceae bacterium]
MSNELPQQNASTILPDDKNLALFAHLLGIVVGFWGALIIWLIHKDNPDKAFVIRHAKEALNFQITVIIAAFVAGLLCFVFVGFLLLPVVLIGNIVLCILAGITASKGEDYRYPIALRLVQ